MKVGALPKQLRVALVDDDEAFLAWARASLDASEQFTVVGETTDPEAVEALVRGVQPDLLLVDFEMPGVTGFEVARRVKERTPSIQVVLMSMHNGAYFEVLARLAGARGFLPKQQFAPHAITSMIGTARAGPTVPPGDAG